MPYDDVPEFLSAIQEIPNDPMSSGNPDEGTVDLPKAWVMKSAKSNGRTSHNSLATRISNAWTGLLDLIKVRVVQYLPKCFY